LTFIKENKRYYKHHDKITYSTNYARLKYLCDKINLNLHSKTSIFGGKTNKKLNKKRWVLMDQIVQNNHDCMYKLV